MVRHWFLVPVFAGSIPAIPASILVFKKSRENPEKIQRKCRENPENVLFIDASKHFHKVKNQNVLRKEDIKKILDTYTNRVEEDKYSHLAKLDEIAENDYNLNIPRYVDTFEEEEPIDLTQVVSEMKKIDAESTELDKKIKEFTDELGVESPF